MLVSKYATDRVNGYPICTILYYTTTNILLFCMEQNKFLNHDLLDLMDWEEL